MLRQFSMTRRRPNHVDLLIPRQSGVDGYRIQSSPNFDGAWTTAFTAPVGGYVDPAIDLTVVATLNTPTNAYGPAVRCIFNPVTYSLTDTAAFWLRFVPVTAGAAGTPGAPTLVLPDASNHGTGLVVIHGTAPSAVSSAGSLQIDLPSLAQDFRIHNEEVARSLYVAFEQDGAEIQCQFGATEQFTSMAAAQSSLWVRGGAGTAAFSLTFTRAFPR